MAIRDVLTLTTVQVAREVYTTDGMGGGSTTTTLTTLSRAAIWQAGSGSVWMSDKMTRDSTHVLATLPGAYTWADNDAKVVYGSEVYEVRGHADNILHRGELVVVGLERLT